ncbi:DUF5080 family protein [Mammaliicoccus stepanovicii]|uniref:DUF5080 family protein n=1 Tax=Mammaliicoccus stepanovicii TaxID=643214 RepID=A0A239ZC18_9STAP|nr:DUF5080 family protein [Mammaliicoccus stepanovicii]PNZ71596.1 DUF5080 domain-containing protein [Mammaliicoccus stepanovicii]GGI42048.1 DUF5080 domain-containing protein [Mammaliicoccus stepanovicii]SNV68695.1 Uncharacterised protein [Mammaliicoccus stepanovicii]
MIYIILVGVFALYYGITFLSLMKTEGIAFFFLLGNIGLIISFIIFYLIGGHLNGNDLSNFVLYTIYGSYFYMYFAFKQLWTKPMKFKFFKVEDRTDEDRDNFVLELNNCKPRGIYLFISSIVLFCLGIHYITQQDAIEISDLNITFIAFGLLIIILWLLMDIYRKIRYKVFIFKTLVPLVVTIWMIITNIIISHKVM